MVVPWMLLTPRFCPVVECEPGPPHAHRGHHLKQACAHFLGRGWIGVAGSRVVTGVGHWQRRTSGLCVLTFGEVKGGKGRGGGCQQRVLIPTPFFTHITPSLQPLQLTQ